MPVHAERPRCRPARGDRLCCHPAATKIRGPTAVSGDQASDLLIPGAGAGFEPATSGVMSPAWDGWPLSGGTTGQSAVPCSGRGPPPLRAVAADERARASMTEPTGSPTPARRSSNWLVPTGLGCLERPIRDGQRHLVTVDSAPILPYKRSRPDRRTWRSGP